MPPQTCDPLRPHPPVGAAPPAKTARARLSAGRLRQRLPLQTPTAHADGSGSGERLVAIGFSVGDTRRLFAPQKLMAAVDGYIAQSGKGVMIEYILIRGVNATAEQAEALGKLLQKRNVQA